MIILEDIGNKDKKHITKHLYFERHGIYFERYPLPCGDYILANETVLDVIARKQKRDIDVKKMDFLGTYNICVDTKKDMQEISGNICGKEHGRFRDELILAMNNNIELYILVENDNGITNIADVPNWQNPRLKIEKPDNNIIIGHYSSGKPKYARIQAYPKATTGDQLAKAMLTMEEKYGCEFLFCKPEESGSMIVELLSR